MENNPVLLKVEIKGEILFPVKWKYFSNGEFLGYGVQASDEQFLCLVPRDDEKSFLCIIKETESEAVDWVIENNKKPKFPENTLITEATSD